MWRRAREAFDGEGGAIGRIDSKNQAANDGVRAHPYLLSARGSGTDFAAHAEAER